jgi:hypothetical protein
MDWFAGGGKLFLKNLDRMLGVLSGDLRGQPSEPRSLARAEAPGEFGVRPLGARPLGAGRPLTPRGEG